MRRDFEWTTTTPRDEDPAGTRREGWATRDRLLMQGVQDGDHGALQALMQRYWSPLVAYALAFTRCRDEAEDVVQETFVQLWRQRANWNRSGAVNAYLYRIARNLAFNACRKRNAQWSREERAGADIFGHGPSRSPEDEYEARSIGHEFDLALNALPQRRREVFVLCRFHGLSHQEIASTLGLSPQTVSNHMSAALADLREALAQYLPSRSKSKTVSRHTVQ